MVLTLGAVRVVADESPAAVAEREATEEREKRLNTRIEDLEKSVQKYQERVATLNEELRGLREEIGRMRESNNESATKENIKRLKDAVEEVDKKRLEDNKRVMTQLDNMRTELRDLIIKNVPTAPPPRQQNGGPTRTPGSSTKKDTETGYEYAVVDNDTLSKIIAKLRAKNMKVTQRQIMDANPDVNWSKLQIGQKIFIPGQ